MSSGGVNKRRRGVSRNWKGGVKKRKRETGSGREEGWRGEEESGEGTGELSRMLTQVSVASNRGAGSRGPNAYACMHACMLRG